MNVPADKIRNDDRVSKPLEVEPEVVPENTPVGESAIEIEYGPREDSTVVPVLSYTPKASEKVVREVVG